jgi:PAS domain S-box-containing protein
MWSVISRPWLRERTAPPKAGAAAPAIHAVDDDWIREEQVLPLSLFTPYVMVVNVVAALIFLWLGGEDLEPPLPQIWSIAVLAPSFLLLMRWLRNGGEAFADALCRSHQNIELYSSGFAILWAALPIIFLRHASPGLQLFIASSAFVAASLGTFALSRMPFAAISFSSIIAGAVLLSGIQAGGDLGHALATMALFFGFTLAGMVHTVYRGFVSRAADVYERRRQSEFVSLLLRDFENCSSDMLWETDRDGALRYFSSRFPMLAARPADSIIGQTFRQAAGASLGDQGWTQFAEAVELKRPIERLGLEVRRGMDTAWWLVTAQPHWDKSGRFHGYRGVIRDITAERAAQADLMKAKEEAERASGAKSQFLAVISHELKTPLNAIIGFSEMLAKEHDGPLGRPIYAEYAETILDSSQHLRGVITDILDVTRIERGTLHIADQEADAAELLEVSYRMCRKQAEKANVPLTLHVTKTAEITGDMTRIRQVLINLITNAIKFSAAGKPVGLSIERPDDGGLRFVVADHGMGIEPEHIERIFEPFEQADSTIARHHGGTGLGLAIARKIARLHGGDVTLDSKKGLGTTAYLTLPAKRVKWLG